MIFKEHYRTKIRLRALPPQARGARAFPLSDAWSDG
jgi:hypothetical protein